MNNKELPINTVVCGDALEVMKTFPDESIDMCITSPPYWGLRDYGIEQIFNGDSSCKHRWGFSKIEHDNLRYRGHNANVGSNKNPEIHKGKEKSGGQICCSCGAWKGQLGLEPTPEMYIEHLTQIFNEVKRVLKKEGTLWLNIGDTYGGSGGAGGDYNEGGLREGQPRFKQGQTKLPSKCLCMISERLAWSMIQNGWILRNKIIWYKPNAMPSSVKDRFSNRWEHIFLFSKSQKYYFDLDAVREPTFSKEGKASRAKGYENITPKSISINRINQETIRKWNPLGKNPGDVIIEEGIIKGDLAYKINQFEEAHSEIDAGWFSDLIGDIITSKLNPSDFWQINTQPFPEAHFAVFPEALCEKPIKAGCPEEICKRCGKAREKIIKRYDTGKTQKMPDYWDVDPGSHGTIHRKGRSKGKTRIPIMANKTIGFTSCDCNSDFDPGIVLDPFAGAGTVGVVAKKFGRRFILIDIKKEYCEMAEKRIAQIGYQMELRA